MDSRVGLGHYVIALLEKLSAVKGFLNIAEVGTMFKTDLEPGETDLGARSTYAIAGWMEARKGLDSFVSIDADYGHIEASRKALGERARQVAHMLGKGTDCLAKIPLSHLDFILLDGDSNAHNTMCEFGIAERLLKPPAIILVDDAFKHPSVNKFAMLRTLRPWIPIGGIAAAIPYGDEAVRICEAVSRG